MADLSNPLTQVSVAQAQPAVTVNNVVDALSPAACFGQNDLTTSGLNWGYYGGRFNGIAIAHSTIALPANQATIYIVADKATGVVSQSTSITNWNDTTNYQRTYIATTGPSTITDWDDYREFIASGLGGGSATWGAISGTLSSQSDLQSELDNKVPANTFEEQVQDIIAGLITAGTNVTKQYNDGDSPATLVISSTAASSLTQEEVEDIVAGLISAGTNVTTQYNDGDSPATLVINSTASGGGSLTQEEVEDICAALITAGSGVTKQYNDGDSPATLVLSASGSGTPAGSDTQVQYNNSSAFGASARFTWTNSTRTLNVNDALDSSGSFIQNPTQTITNTVGQSLTLRGGVGNGTQGGGAAFVTGGAGGATGAGGGATITGGAAGGGAASGGTVTLQGGATSGAANGAGISLICAAGGTSGSVTGGAMIVTAGAGHIGGGMTFTTGASSQAGVAGGNIRLIMGAPGAGGTYGQIRWELDDGTRRGTFHGAGKLNIGPTTSAPTVNFLVEGSTSVTATSTTATTTTTINLATTNVHKIAMNANITTFTVNNPSDCQEVTIIFTQDGTGSRTLAWPAAFKFVGGAPTLSTPAGSVDMYTGIYNSTTSTYLGRLEKAFA